MSGAVPPGKAPQFSLNSCAKTSEGHGRKLGHAISDPTKCFEVHVLFEAMPRQASYTSVQTGFRQNLASVRSQVERTAVAIHVSTEA
jgi:hypothetical protein